MCTACGIMHPRCCRAVTLMRRNSASRLLAGNIVCALYHKLYTQSSAPEDGRYHRPKHVELIGIINKLLLLHLVGCLYYLQTSEFGANAASPLPPTHIHTHTQFIYPHIIQYSMSELPDPDYKHFSICKKM